MVNFVIILIYCNFTPANSYYEISMNENQIEKKKRINPFFLPYNTPHDTIPFNSIQTSDFEEAFMEGIRRDDEEIQKIINDKDTPTFENTTEAETTRMASITTNCWTGY